MVYSFYTANSVAFEKKNKDSIKTCQNSDEVYFKHLVTGESFSFNKYVDERDAVNN